MGDKYAAQRNSLADKLHTLQSAYDTLFSEWGKVVGERDAARAEAEHHLDCRNALRDEVDELRALAAANKDALEQYNKECKALRKIISRKDREWNGLLDQRDELRAQIANYYTPMVNGQAMELAELRAKLITFLEAKLEQWAMAYDGRLVAKIAELRATLEATEEMSHEIYDEVVKLRAKLEAKEKALDVIKGHYDELEAKLVTLEAAHQNEMAARSSAEFYAQGLEAKLKLAKRTIQYAIRMTAPGYDRDVYKTDLAVIEAE